MKSAWSLRKVLAIILSLSLAASVLSGCGASTHSSSTKSTSHSSSVTSSKAASSSASSKSQIPAGAISWEDARAHVGETVTIYGPVTRSKYASTSNGSPTFIDIGASYPSDNRVTMTIWGKSRSAFPSSPEGMYNGKTVCVTGEVYLYKGVCNIEVTSPSQIQVL